MEKKAYHLTLQYTKDNQNEPVNQAPVELTFTNHDNPFEIIDRPRSRSLFGSEAETAGFAIGLKLFGEVMLRNRKHPLFEAFGPAFRDFMKKLKSGGAKTAAKTSFKTL